MIKHRGSRLEGLVPGLSAGSLMGVVADLAMMVSSTELIEPGAEEAAMRHTGSGRGTVVSAASPVFDEELKRKVLSVT